MRLMTYGILATMLTGCASGMPLAREPGRLPHYDILVPLHRVTQTGHFVIRSRGAFQRLQEAFGGQAWWDSLEIVPPDFHRSMIIGLAMQESGCGPQSLVRQIGVNRDTIQVFLERSDILGPCDTLSSWVELAVIARHDGRAVVFIPPDSQWTGVPYVAHEIVIP